MSERTINLPDGLEPMSVLDMAEIWKKANDAYGDQSFLASDVIDLVNALEAAYKQIDSLQQQVNSLNEESLANFRTAAERGKQLVDRDRTIAKLQDVLIFYWKPEKYVADEFYEDGHPKSCVITRDRSKKAEEVLKPFEM
ncbi:hypothetical protein ABE82_26550 (plasmid) [Paenibacillus peoriae]|uniref:hypothetical protein n=1 Tax=Paenibacillus peoriae TaxID=59893 RepID=UPI000721EC75|nr:hypothetical protein [Paenibacillus peoriae]ALS09975.1 hypothetical protein ABE82_26550 [Paenibacillus peoriae]